MLPSECEQLLITGYVLGDLSPAEAALFAEIVAENPEILERVAEFQQTLELAYAPPEIAPPPSLRAKILNEASNKNVVIRSSNTDRLSTVLNVFNSRIFWSKVLGGLTVVTIAILGITNYHLWQSLQQAKNEREINTVAYTLKSPKPDELGIVKLMVDPDRLEATLNVRNLSPLPSGKVYALWTVVGKDAHYTTDAKGAILTATFQVNADGTFSQKIAVPPLYRTDMAIDKLAVTIESASAPQTHQGSILFVTDDFQQSSQLISYPSRWSREQGTGNSKL
jgi:anti-sigma-K factor RskA